MFLMYKIRLPCATTHRWFESPRARIILCNVLSFNFVNRKNRHRKRFVPLSGSKCWMVHIVYTKNAEKSNPSFDILINPNDKTSGPVHHPPMMHLRQNLKKNVLLIFLIFICVFHFSFVMFFSKRIRESISNHSNCTRSRNFEFFSLKVALFKFPFLDEQSWCC